MGSRTFRTVGKHALPPRVVYFAMHVYCDLDSNYFVFGNGALFRRQLMHKRTVTVR